MGRCRGIGGVRTALRALVGEDVGERQAGKGARFRSDVLAVLDALLGPRRDVRSGQMFGQPGYFVGRRLFACVYGDGVALKLPAEALAGLNGSPECRPFAPWNRGPMRQWVLLVRPRAEDYLADADLLEQSITFVGDAA